MEVSDESTSFPDILLLNPVIEKDPTVNMEKWKKGVEYLRESMPILNKGYDDYIHEKSGSGGAK